MARSTEISCDFAAPDSHVIPEATGAPDEHPLTGVHVQIRLRKRGGGTVTSDMLPPSLARLLVEEVPGYQMELCIEHYCEVTGEALPDAAKNWTPPDASAATTDAPSEAPATDAGTLTPEPTPVT